jgi:hypothetical protein
MKHLLKFPQKKAKCNISYLDKPIKINLNEIKIKNFIGNNIIECYIPPIQNNSIISTIEDIDVNSLETLKRNPDWIETCDNIENIYTNSYSKDISCLNVLFNNKTECFINGIERDLEDTIELLRDNKKIKELNVRIDISFLGLFIYDHLIINKWVIKNIDIEDSSDDIEGWDKEEIEEDWDNEIKKYENDIRNKIENYNNSLSNAKNLLEEIRDESCINNWEKKINKLKKYILKL